MRKGWAAIGRNRKIGTTRRATLGDLVASTRGGATRRIPLATVMALVMIVMGYGSDYLG